VTILTALATLDADHERHTGLAGLDLVATDRLGFLRSLAWLAPMKRVAALGGEPDRVIDGGLSRVHA
jgi:hypothetical protein